MKKVMEHKMLEVQREWSEMAADENDEFNTHTTRQVGKEDNFDRPGGDDERAPSQDRQPDVPTAEADHSTKLSRSEDKGEENELPLKDLEVCDLRRRIEALEEGRSADLHRVARLNYRLAFECTSNARLWLEFATLHLENLHLSDEVDALGSKNAAPSGTSPGEDGSPPPAKGKRCCTGCLSENGADKWGIFFCKLSECPCCADSKGDYCPRCLCLSDVEVRSNENPQMLEQKSGSLHVVRPMRPYTQRPYKWGSSAHLPPWHARARLQRPYVGPHSSPTPSSSGTQGQATGRTSSASVRLNYHRQA